MYCVRALPIAVLLAAAPAMAATPNYAGTWAANPAQCKVPQERQGAPMILTAKGYDQHEAHCNFASVRKVRRGWRMAANCTVEGNPQRDTFTVKVSGDTMVMTSGKLTRRFKRCG